MIQKCSSDLCALWESSVPGGFWLISLCYTINRPQGITTNQIKAPHSLTNQVFGRSLVFSIAIMQIVFFSIWNRFVCSSSRYKKRQGKTIIYENKKEPAYSQNVCRFHSMQFIFKWLLEKDLKETTENAYLEIANKLNKDIFFFFFSSCNQNYFYLKR